MFYVYPEAAVSIPRGLTPRGERAYNWVELSVPCCYFLVTISAKIDDEDSLGRHIFVGRVKDVLSLANDYSPTLAVTRVDLMSPGYLHDGDGYRLGRVVEIWRDRNSSLSYLFKFADGTSIEDSFGSIKPMEPCMDLLWSRYD